jgi:long-chain acyl-CoA synthetase
MRGDGLLPWFKQRVDAFRRGLASAARQGDRVSIISSNRVDWAVASFATLGPELFVPMYEPQLPKDWEFILKDCE